MTRAYTFGALGLLSDSADRPIDPANGMPPTSVTLAGTVTLEGLTQPAGTPLTCTLVSTRQSVAPLMRTVTLGNGGAFTLPNVPPDVYVLSIKADQSGKTL